MLGNKIKLYRENKKMTQNDLANILEVSSGTISKYESGALEPNIESLKKLADLFGITIDELLKDEEKFDFSNVNVLKALREQKEMKLKGNLYHQTQVSFAYNTNHIEGSTLTEDQTRYIFETNTILFEGDTVAKVDDILETSNHFKLVDYMLEFADKKLTEKMIKEFECNPKDIICCICPSIRKCHFEVEKDVKDMFENEFKDLENLNNIIEEKIPNTKWIIDTVLINEMILEKQGLKKENIIDSGICSVCNSDLIHSYRVEKKGYGLNTALISLN